MNLMKPLLLIFAALPLLAQEPAAPPANEPVSERPELPSPAPRDDKLLELLRKNPTPEPQQTAPKKATKADEKAGAAKPPKVDPSRDKNRSTLLPPSTSNDLDLRIRYRKARTNAERDPAVIAAWDASRTARTDYAKRAALTRYYELIRAKVLSTDRGVALILEERHAFTTKRLTQTRVSATQPIGGAGSSTQSGPSVPRATKESEVDSIDEDSVRNQ